MTRSLRLAFALVCLAPGAVWAQRIPCPEFQVNTYTTGHQSLVGVVSDADGNFLVVWGDEHQGGNASGQRFSSLGVALGPAFPMDMVERVASDASGNFVVLRTGYDVSSTGVFARRYSAAGVPSSPQFQVNSYTTAGQGSASVAVDADGDFVVVWLSEHEGTSQVFARRFDSGGVAQGPEFRVNTYTTALHRAPAVATDEAGNFTVIWESSPYDGDPFGAVVGQRFDSGGVRQGPEFRVNTYTTYEQHAPTVASDPNGNLVVVWMSETQDGGWEGVFGQRFDSTGSRVGSEFPVNTYTTGYQTLPSVAVGADGSFLVSWMSSSGSGIDGDVFARRFSPSGVPEGPEFQVNTHTADNQGPSSVAATGAGGFVVAWDSNLQDGSGVGVFARVDCASRFYSLSPCRVVDTREPPGLPVGANSSRSFNVGGACGIPADAQAVAVNVTAVNPTDLGNLRLYAAGQPPPMTSSLNFAAGRTRANSALIALGSGGQVTVQCDMRAGSTGTTHLLLDVSGYFKR